MSTQLDRVCLLKITKAFFILQKRIFSFRSYSLVSRTYSFHFPSLVHPRLSLLVLARHVVFIVTVQFAAHSLSASAISGETHCPIVVASSWRVTWVGSNAATIINQSASEHKSEACTTSLRSYTQGPSSQSLLWSCRHPRRNASASGAASRTLLPGVVGRLWRWLEVSGQNRHEMFKNDPTIFEQLQSSSKRSARCS